MRMTRTGASLRAFAAARPAKPPPTITTVGVDESLMRDRYAIFDPAAAAADLTSEAARLCGSTHRCFATHTPWTFHHATSRFSTAFSYTMRRPSPMLNNPERPRNVRLARPNCTVSRAGALSNTLMSAMPIIEPTPNTAIYGNAANRDGI